MAAHLFSQNVLWNPNVMSTSCNDVHCFVVELDLSWYEIARNASTLINFLEEHYILLKFVCGNIRRWKIMKPLLEYRHFCEWNNNNSCAMCEIMAYFTLLYFTLLLKYHTCVEIKLAVFIQWNFFSHNWDCNTLGS